jgi:hypothetical protein
VNPSATETGKGENRNAKKTLFGVQESYATENHDSFLISTVYTMESIEEPRYEEFTASSSSDFSLSKVLANHQAPKQDPWNVL